MLLVCWPVETVGVGCAHRVSSRRMCLEHWSLRAVCLQVCSPLATQHRESGEHCGDYLISHLAQCSLLAIRKWYAHCYSSGTVWHHPLAYAIVV